MKDLLSDDARQCPSIYELNAWHDGEMIDGLTDHVSACPKCQKIVADYDRLETALRQGIPTHDELLIDRIILHCQPRTPARAFIFHLTRVAAILMIVVGLYGMFAQWSGQRPATAGQDLDSLNTFRGINLNDMPGQFVVLLKNNGQVQPAYGPWLFRSQDDLSPGIVPVNQLVALSDPRPRSMSPLPVSLPQKVRHVWVVEDLRASRETLIENLPQGARCALRHAEDEQSVELTIWLSDDRLQELVDVLANDMDWALVSSELPQPGQKNRLLSQGREIEYKCSLILR